MEKTILEPMKIITIINSYDSSYNNILIIYN